MCAKLRSCVLLHRFGAFLSALSLCFVLCVPSLADEVISGTMSVYVYSFQPTSSSSGTWSSDRLSLNSGSSGTRNIDNGVNSRFGWTYLVNGNVNTSSEGTYGIYLSCYYRSSDSAKQNHPPTSSDFALVYKSSNTGVSSSYPVSIKLFSPSSSYNSLSDGVTVSARFTQSVTDTVSDWLLVNGSVNVPSWTFDTVGSTTRFYGGSFVVTNAQVVSTATNDELDALENMASNIAAQNQILSQFYGDIVAVCNQIYQRLGDLQAAQEEANRLFSNVISLLNTTNSKIEAINMAMSTYFELLINQLKQEGIDTRAAIADAEARLEAYLKPMIDYFTELEKQSGESAATLPGHKTDIDGFNNQGFGIDSDGQAGVAALVPILSAFGWIWSIIALFIGVGLIHILVKKGIG